MLQLLDAQVVGVSLLSLKKLVHFLELKRVDGILMMIHLHLYSVYRGEIHGDEFTENLFCIVITDELQYYTLCDGVLHRRQPVS